MQLVMARAATFRQVVQYMTGALAAGAQDDRGEGPSRRSGDEEEEEEEEESSEDEPPKKKAKTTGKGKGKGKGKA